MTAGPASPYRAVQHFHEYLNGPWGRLALLTFAGIAAGQALLALWVAKGRAHWLLRALVLWGGVMLLVPIRAYEPAAIFAIASPLIVAIFAFSGWIKARGRTTTQPARNPDQPATVRFNHVDGYFFAAIGALLIAGLETIYQGRWWYDFAAFVAWAGIIAMILSLACDCALTRGQMALQYLRAALQFASAGFRLLIRLLTTPLESHSASASSADAAPPRSGRFRFSLRDLLFFMFFVALVVFGLQAIDQGYTWHDWQAFTVWGALLALIVSLAYSCAVSRWRLLIAPLLLAVVAGAGWPLISLFKSSAAERITSTLVVLGDQMGDDRWTGLEKIALLAALHKEFALLMVALSLLACLSLASAPKSLRRGLARGVLAVVVLAGCVPLAWLYGQMLWLTPAPPEFATSVNHYDRILAIVSHADPNWWSGAPPYVPSVAGDKQQLIDELSLLTREANYISLQMPDKPYTPDQLQSYRNQLNSCVSFAKVIAAEASAASARGEHDRAADLALVNIRLGTMLRRGGTLSNASNGERCQTEGYKVLAKIRGDLSPAMSRTVLAELSRAATSVERIETVYLRDQAFSERLGGWRSRLRNISFDMRGVGLRGYVDVEITTFNVLLQTDLAIRLYLHDHGEFPKTLDDLIPAYLPKVPRDPLASALVGPAYPGSDQPLCYRVENAQFILYSVGYLGEDNAGHFGNEIKGLHHSGYDVDVETWTRP